MITISSLTQPQSKRNSLLRLQLDASGLIDELQKANNCIIKASNKDEVMRDMAFSVIQSAQDDELIPYKTNYRIRMRQKYKLLNKVYKSGAKKGQQKKKTLSPKDYYSYYRKKMDNVYESREDPTHWKDEEKWDSYEYEYRSNMVFHYDLAKTRFMWITTTSEVTGNMYSFPINLQLGWKERVGHVTKDEYTSNTRTWNRGEGTKITPTGHTVNKTIRKRRNWKYIKDISSEATEYNKTYTSEKDKNGYYHYVMNRTPHLRDTDMTHVVTVAKHRANIRISVRKPKDDRFYEEGGVNYAYWQYFGGEEESDAKWNRATDGTTMRWLEVALGLYKPKRGSVFVNSKENYDTMKDILQTEINETLKANGVQIK